MGIPSKVKDAADPRTNTNYYMVPHLHGIQL